MTATQYSLKNSSYHNSTDPLRPDIIQFICNSLKVESVEIDPLAGDASARRYFRVISHDLSYVLMLWEPFKDDGRYPFLNVLEHFKRHHVNVPQVVSCAPHLGCVLLEDLGDLTLERKFWENQNQAHALPFYKQAIDEIIKIHYSASKDTSAPCVAFQVAFDTEKLLWEMNYGREHLIEKLTKTTLTPAERATLDKIFIDICSKLSSQPRHICHRDYHSRNLMLKLGKMRVIDFQDARMGPIQYDLVSLVYDSYVNLSEEIRLSILDDYIAKAQAQRGSAISRDEFFSVIRLQVVQRCFKACGSFSSFFNIREDTRYLKYISHTLETVTHTLSSFKEYSDFYMILNDRGLLEYDYMKPLSSARSRAST